MFLLLEDCNKPLNMCDLLLKNKYNFISIIWLNIILIKQKKYKREGDLIITFSFCKFKYQNLTSMTLYFVYKNRDYVIKPGEVLKLS